MSSSCQVALKALALFATATLGAQTADAASAAFAPASSMPARRDCNAQGAWGTRSAPASLRPVQHGRCRPELELASSSRRKCGTTKMALHDREQPRERDQMTRMLKDFLTQRAVQTYLTTIEQVGERSDFDFIEGYHEHHGLSQVHGYGALRVEWHEYLSGMLRMPEQTITRKIEQFRGGSKGNPYIQAKAIEITSTVSPRKLTNTIMELRMEVSKEWEQDLQLIVRENAEHWRHHVALVTNGTDADEGLQHSFIQAKETDSALRLDNYDLLEKFCTHVACTQVMMELAAKTADEHQAIWFKSYLEGHASLKIVGSRGAGRQFIKDLLEEPPRVITLQTSGDEVRQMKLIDPLDIAARVMAQRQVVAERWIEALKATEEDHLNIHRAFMMDCLSSMDNVLSKLEKLL